MTVPLLLAWCSRLQSVKPKDKAISEKTEVKHPNYRGSIFVLTTVITDLSMTRARKLLVKFDSRQHGICVLPDWSEGF